MYNRYKPVTARMPEVADSALYIYVRARALHPAQARKGRENAITANKNTKKTVCAFYRTDSAWTDLVAGVSVSREGEIAIAPEIGLKIPTDARALNNIMRVHIPISVIYCIDDQYICIYMRGGC